MDPEAGSRGDDPLNALIRLAATPKGEWGRETSQTALDGRTEDGSRVWITPRKASKPARSEVARGRTGPESEFRAESKVARPGA